VKKSRKRAPRCIIIAGPNRAGKTTFAQEFLPKYAKVVHFVNADLIAGGLSPLNPESAAIDAGRVFLKDSIVWLPVAPTSLLRARSADLVMFPA